jgi:hypothetical protein
MDTSHNPGPGSPSDNIDVVLTELQTFGDIRSFLESGLTPDQVVEVMVFRARLIQLLHQIIVPSEPATVPVADVLLGFLADVELDLLASVPSGSARVVAADSSELLAACHTVVAILQANEAPELPDLGLTDPREVFLDIYRSAREHLPVEVVRGELITQLSDIFSGAGVWNHSNPE